MGKYADMESDEYRLPEGFTRTGYDADTQQYHYTDENGAQWVGAPGNRYGELNRVGAVRERRASAEEEEEDQVEAIRANDRAAWRTFSSFLVLVGLFLLVVFWLTRVNPVGAKSPAAADADPDPHKACNDGHRAYLVQSGDSCWSIAQDFETDVGGIVGENEGLNCDRLLADVGVICVPDRG